MLLSFLLLSILVCRFNTQRLLVPVRYPSTSSPSLQPTPEPTNRPSTNHDIIDLSESECNIVRREGSIGLDPVTIYFSAPIIDALSTRTYIGDTKLADVANVTLVTLDGTSIYSKPGGYLVYNQPLSAGVYGIVINSGGMIGNYEFSIKCGIPTAVSPEFDGCDDEWITEETECYESYGCDDRYLCHTLTLRNDGTNSVRILNEDEICNPNCRCFCL